MTHLETILVVLSLVFFGLGTFNAITKINPIAAGAFCLSLAILYGQLF